ncbi:MULTISPECIES: ABC transporter permease subunit [Streptomyces]|uniref:ABC transporter permease subunit n=1 Tax=Streptomyces TaxID=1883 RepID=UPI001FCC4812|nr:ABC transporter permease subunit [Streptomyces melanosporofaciens]
MAYLTATSQLMRHGAAPQALPGEDVHQPLEGRVRAVGTPAGVEGDGVGVGGGQFAVTDAVAALGAFLLRQFFLGVPRDYEEATRLDGANRWQTFIRVIIPLAVPAIATLAVFKFISQWKASP